jgi:hypothetical protein
MISIGNQVDEYVCLVLTVLDEGRGRMGSYVVSVRELLSPQYGYSLSDVSVLLQLALENGRMVAVIILKISFQTFLN